MLGTQPRVPRAEAVEATALRSSFFHLERARHSIGQRERQLGRDG
jgi:hypothetical protein